MAAEYQHIRDYDGVLRYADNATIPPDGANRDWQQYQNYVAAGGETDPAPDPGLVTPERSANDRLDAGIVAATTVMTQPEVQPNVDPGDSRPATKAELDVVQAQLDRLEAAMREMLVSQAVHATPFDETANEARERR